MIHNVTCIHSLVLWGIFSKGFENLSTLLYRMSDTVPYTLISVLLVVVVVAFYISRLFVTVPFYARAEGFYGGVARGAGTPDSLRNLPESSQLLERLAKAQGTSEYDELELILSKLASLKKDLLSPSGVVDATRYQAFDTTHDRAAVAEVCAMCMTQTIAPRDLDISFATWRDRGALLIRRLSTQVSLSDAQTDQALKLFSVCWEDVYQIAQQKCLKTVGEQGHGSGKGSDVGSYEPPSLKGLRSYDVTYGGLSASGWNGAV
jgi:hypothetical protein